MSQDQMQQSVREWLMRKLPESSERRIAELPVAIATDIGNVRTENQDRVAILRAQLTNDKSFLVAVLCDGMGGMVNGAGCASLAVAAFLSSCIQQQHLAPKWRLRAAVEDANAWVNSEYDEKGGTTLSAFLIDSDGNFIGVNVGDSRIYCLSSDNKLRQLTRDDTLAGQFYKDQEGSPVSNELLQFIGMGSGLEPHMIALPESESITQLYGFT